MKTKALFLAAAGLLAACNEGGGAATCTIEDTDDGRVLRCPDGTEAPLGTDGGAGAGDGGSGGGGNETGSTGDGGSGEGGERGTVQASCTLESGSDGQYALRCPDGSEATFAGTTDDGTDCVVEPDGSGGLQVRCDDGSTTPLGNTHLGSGPDGGPAGGNCTATLEGNVASVRCDDGSNFTFMADTVVQGPDVLLLTPDDSRLTLRSRPRFDWTDAATAGARYRVEVARDADFEDMVLTSDALDASEFRPATSLPLLDDLYWRVQTLGVGDVVLATSGAKLFRSGFGIDPVWLTPPSPRARRAPPTGCSCG